MFSQRMPSRMACLSSSQPRLVLALVSRKLEIAAFLRKRFDLAPADAQAAGIHAPGDQQLGERLARGAGEIAVPLAQRLEEIFLLAVEDQHRQRGFVHVKLVDQPLVRLAAEIPEPDFPLDAVAGRHGQLPLRRPRADRRVAGFPVIQRQPLGKPRLARAALADEEDFGVRVLDLVRRERQGWRGGFRCSRLGDEFRQIPHPDAAALVAGEGAASDRRSTPRS